MQAIMDYQAPKIEKKIEKAWKDHVIYGKPLPDFTDTTNNKHKGGTI